jgi:bifunctional non-homologous end joining protein LigD
LNRKVTYDDTKPFARAVARLLEKERPGQVVSSMKKEVRRGKVFVDWSQNDRHKTTICAYSLRIAERPTVSTPISWDEVHEALEHGDADALTFEAPAVLERVADGVDHYAASLTAHQVLPELRPS